MKGDNSDEIDTRLAIAAETSMKTKSISPVLREELRLSILNRRHANGQEDLAVEFKEPVSHELTPAEIEKKLRRREQNRRAARKCREKKKQKQEGTFLTLAQMIEENKTLEAEINLLKSQKAVIKDFLTSHDACVSIKQEVPDPCPISPASCNPCDILPNCESFPVQSTSTTCPVPGQADQCPTIPPSTTELADALPQSLVEFCLEHLSTEEEHLYDYSEDMRRQTVSVSSVASDADIFGLDSDSDTVTLTSDNSGLSEDEDVFQSVPWVLPGVQSYLPLNSTTSGAASACVDTTYMQYLNFAEQ